jgi:protein subunit release factor A
MESIKEIKEHYMRSVRLERFPKQFPGGQSVNWVPRGVKLISDDLGFEVAMTLGRSEIANRELAMTLFSLYLDEVIK